MATIYEFIVRDQTNDGKKLIVDNETGEVIGKSSVAKQKPLSGSNKGVDHNRYTRAINPLVNRYIPNFEKYVRGSRAITGVIDTTLKEGLKAGLTGVGAVVLFEMAIIAIDNWRRDQIEKANQENLANYNKLVSGQSQLSQNVQATKNIFGKITFKNQ